MSLISKKKALKKQRVQGKKKSFHWLFLFSILIFSTTSSFLLKKKLEALWYSGKPQPEYQFREPLPSSGIRDFFATHLQAKNSSSISPKELGEIFISFPKTARLHIYQTPPNSFTLAVEEREPEFFASADKKFLLMSDGSFCLNQEKESIPKDFPFLLGLFSKIEHDETPCSLPTEERRQAIVEAKKLKMVLSTHNSSVKNFTYDKYQGLTAFLENPKIVAHFGFSSFEKKADRLQQIFYKNPGKSIEVDLDFKNKAFIKELQSDI